MRSFAIAGRPVGPGAPCFVIAEAGVNHNGSLELALRLVDEAAAAGADAVKFQTFRAERLVTAAAPRAEYQARNTGDAGTQLEMLRRLELSEEAHAALLERCRERGILFLSTPFDDDSADLLVRLDVPAFKVSSGDLTNLPFLERLAAVGRPVILSTGMATLGDAEAALAAVRRAGDPPVALLQCVSEYPARASDANLAVMATYERCFAVPSGYSDHTLGLEVAFAAVALGARVLEKHFTLDRGLPGPDHQASLEPGELRALVAGVRAVEGAVGNGCKTVTPGELDNARAGRKSLVAAADLAAGTRLTRAEVDVLRPGTGLSPAQLPIVLGRTLRHEVAAGTLLDWGMLD